MKISLRCCVFAVYTGVSAAKPPGGARPIFGGTGVGLLISTDRRPPDSIWRGNRPVGNVLASADALGRPGGAIQGDVIAGQRPTQGFRGRFRARTTFDDSGAVRGHRNARARRELNVNAGLRPSLPPCPVSARPLPRHCFRIGFGALRRGLAALSAPGVVWVDVLVMVGLPALSRPLSSPWFPVSMTASRSRSAGERLATAAASTASGSPWSIPSPSSRCPASRSFAFSGSLVQTLVQTGKGVGVSAESVTSSVVGLPSSHGGSRRFESFAAHLP